MTDEQLKQGQDLKRTIKLLESEIEKFDTNNPNGINVATKDMKDWNGLIRTYRAFPEIWDNIDSNRIYVFDNQRKNYEDVKPLLEGINSEVLGRKWQQVFNTPDNEYFVRLPILF